MSDRTHCRRSRAPPPCAGAARSVTPQGEKEMKRAAHPGSARAELKLWTDNLFNDRLNCVEGRAQGTLNVVPLGQELRCVVTHGDRSLPVLPNQHLEWEIQTR